MKTVLIVDDDPDIRELIVAGDGEAGLVAAANGDGRVRRRHLLVGDQVPLRHRLAQPHRVDVAEAVETRHDIGLAGFRTEVVCRRCVAPRPRVQRRGSASTRASGAPGPDRFSVSPPWSAAR